jgi:hypothetical protein
MDVPVLQGVPKGSALPRRGKDILRTQGKSADIYSYAVKRPLCSIPFFPKQLTPSPLNFCRFVYVMIKSSLQFFFYFLHSMGPNYFSPVSWLRPLCQTPTHEKIYYCKCSFIPWQLSTHVQFLFIVEKSLRSYRKKKKCRS